MSKFTFNRLMTYFFRGLLFVVPLALTIYIIYESLEWIDGLIPLALPGLGLVIVVTAITTLGFVASFFITRPFFDYVEKLIIRIPLVSIMYTSIKDLIGAFVGDQKKFNVPVLVRFDDKGSILKVGFITHESLDLIDLPEYISVYLPHSYNWSGNHLLVKSELVRPLHMSSTAAMKFVVSAGVSGLDPADLEEVK